MVGFFFLNLLRGVLILFIYFIFKYPFRSEQDKEPEKEVMSEAVGAGPSEESTDDGM